VKLANFTHLARQSEFIFDDFGAFLGVLGRFRRFLCVSVRFWPVWCVFGTFQCAFVRRPLSSCFVHAISSQWLGKTEDGARVAKRRGKINGRHLFVALKDEIKAELDAGAYAIDVHVRYESRLDIRYRQFLKYIKRYELRDSDPKPQSMAAPALPALPARQAAPPNSAPPASNYRKRQGEPINARREPPKRFIFDPTDIDPDKLI
jgi:hypothetical protein